MAHVVSQVMEPPVLSDLVEHAGNKCSFLFDYGVSITKATFRFLCKGTHSILFFNNRDISDRSCLIFLRGFFCFVFLCAIFYFYFLNCNDKFMGKCVYIFFGIYSTSVNMQYKRCCPS